MNAYTCYTCGKTFKTLPGGTRVACAVNHPPGVCCHYNEQIVNQCSWCGGLIEPGVKDLFGSKVDIWVHISPYWPDNKEMCAPSFAKPKKNGVE